MCDRSGIENLIEEAPAGASFLISGPPMTGKYDLFVQLLSAGHAIAVSTDTDAKTLREDFGEHSNPDSLSVVDCASHARGAETPELDGIRYVPGPGNLTRIGTAFTSLFDQHSGGAIRVGLHSVSPLLMYAELRSVYRFLQVFTGQVETAGGLCLGTFDPTMHDESTVNTVLDPFDARIETRLNNGTRKAQVTGFGPESSDWLTF
jgi:hypothetical protein